MFIKMQFCALLFSTGVFPLTVFNIGNGLNKFLSNWYFCEKSILSPTININDFVKNKSQGASGNQGMRTANTDNMEKNIGA